MTLLVANSAAMEALPLCLNELVTEVVAVVISVSAVLAFGEIIPQAVCTGPSQIKIASTVAPVTKFLMMISAFISFPLGKILDLLLGEHGKSRYCNNDLKALIELHSEKALKDIMENGQEDGIGLNVAQTQLINGTIDLISTKAESVMKTYDQVTAVSSDQVVDEDFIKMVNSLGFSRYPVYRGANRNLIIGILLVKRLVGVAAGNKTVGELGLKLRKPLVISPAMCLTDLLVEFEKGRSHLAIVTEQTEAFKTFLGINLRNSVEIPTNFEGNSKVLADSKILGIVTLEDVMEKALGG